MRGGFDHTPDRLDAGLMSMQARELPPCGPASIAVHDDADVKPGGVGRDIQFRYESTLHYKVSFQKKGSGREDSESGNRHVLFSGGLGGVADQAFQHREVIEKAAAAAFGQPATGMRTVALIALDDFDQACFLQHLQM